MSYRRAVAVLTAVGFASLTGCGPPVGEVEGAVTYAGKPVGSGYVMLFPTDGNYRASKSVKIEGGRYRVAEVPPGTLRVSLEGLLMEPDGGEGKPALSGFTGVPETVDIAPGKQTIDFNLTAAEKRK